MKDAIIFLLALALVVLGWFTYSQTVALRQQRNQVQDLTTKLDLASKTASLDLQEKCAKQAQEFLSQFDNKGLLQAMNHYSAKLGKCFVETRISEHVAGEHTYSEIVTDAFEGKDYGTYIEAGGSVGSCRAILPTNGEEVWCKSSDEFHALMKPYME